LNPPLGTASLGGKYSGERVNLLRKLYFETSLLRLKLISWLWVDNCQVRWSAILATSPN
jgi:hypothetical protein